MTDTASVEILGQRCLDGGKCHHDCTTRCFRRECCEPFSGYSGPWAYPKDGAPSTPEADLAQEREASALAWMRAMAKDLGCEADPSDPDGNTPF